VSAAKWERRDAKLRKRKSGMRVSGRSVFTIQAVQKKKADTARKSKPKTKTKPKRRRKKK
jgi:hypothetical protein